MKAKAETKILVVDDEKSILEFLEIMLKREGYAVETAESSSKALTFLKKSKFDLIISDISMPEMDGIQLLTKVRQIHSESAVIIMTAHGSTGSAVEAMKLGASDYLTKPFQIDEMKIAIETALKSVELEKENRNLKTQLGMKFSLNNIVGTSIGMQEVFDLVKRVAPTKSNIMILGESGTGKELVAQAIHANSLNPATPFVVINCAAVPETLFESELFGHKKGAFTGAIQDKIGIFEQANTGTLFLDEVGDIPLAIQVKLLRAIQQKIFRPIGGTEDVTVDVRIICATNKNLEDMLSKGTFREDLFYRLNVIQIRLPSLRERKEDIPILAEHFLNRFTLVMGKPIKSISKEAMSYLLNYSYPGNIRELENIIERAVALESQSTILPESLPQKIVLHKESTPSKEPIASPSTSTGTFDLEKGVENFEKLHIVRALEETKGVKKRAAELLGISFRSLRYRIEKYGINDPNPEEKE
jgi:two-component system, NtrC family, response regulator PilR